MVTASNRGPLFSAARQRAARTSSAVESGPPETARRRAGAWTRSANSDFASAAETGAASAAGTLLFPVDALLHGDGRARIFAQDLAERGTGRFLLAQGGERLAEAQQRLRCLAGCFVFGRHREEGLRRVAELLPLEQAFAEPIVRVGRQPIAGEFNQEAAEAIFRKPVVLAQHVAISEVVVVLRTVR